jgi:peptidoglycan/LPS O-acetylase OafA/YrhL
LYDLHFSFQTENSLDEESGEGNGSLDDHRGHCIWWNWRRRNSEAALQITRLLEIGGMSEPKVKRSFVTLDGLRGIAALGIISRHSPAYFANGFFESYLAVDFFFVLSGFVLAHAYIKRFHQGLTTIHFMTIRLVRLYPLYLFALAISALLGWRELAHGEIVSTDFVKNLIPALFFLPSPPLHEGARLFPLNEPAWSLFFELLANLGFALMCRHLSRDKLCVTVLLASLALSLAVIAGLFGFAIPGIGAMNAGFEWRSFVAGLLRVSYSFFAGVLVYRTWSNWRPVIKVPPAALVVLLIGILVAHPPHEYQIAFDLIITIFIFPIVIWLGAGSVATGPIARIFTWLGLSSYAVYVLQVPLYNLSQRACGKIRGDECNFGITYGIFFVALVFAIAVIADRYFDSPVRLILTTRLNSIANRLGPSRAALMTSDGQSSRLDTAPVALIASDNE